MGCPGFNFIISSSWEKEVETKMLKKRKTARNTTTNDLKLRIFNQCPYNLSIKNKFEKQYNMLVATQTRHFIKTSKIKE
jgi:hypothetical protein